jgi:hypothetical protein
MSIKTLFLTTLLLVTTKTVSSISDTSFKPLDLPFLNSLFTPIGQYNVIKTGYPDSIINEDVTKERLIKIPAVYTEQCIFECLKMPNCIRYSFNATSCRIYLTQQRRQFDKNTASRIKDQADVDLESCVNDVYCADYTEKNNSNIVLCDPLNTSGDKCQFKNSYELSDWTDWTSCSLTCDQGLRRRERSCLRNLYDWQHNKTVREVTSYESMCQTDGLKIVEMQQVESCMLKKCQVHTEWSVWSTCNKLCDGSQNRSRECLLDDASSVYCLPLYLNETKSCGFNNCSLLTLGIYL